MHVGMFWTLIAGIASERQAGMMLSQLTNPRKFWRATPVATLAADQPGFSPAAIIGSAACGRPPTN